MPKCPKCNRLYTADETICKDCETELIEYDPSTLVTFKEVDKKPQAGKFVKFLHYSNIASAAYEYNEENNTWNILVHASDLKETKKLYDAFYTVEAENALNHSKNDVTMQNKDSVDNDLAETNSNEYSSTEETIDKNILSSIVDDSEINHDENHKLLDEKDQQNYDSGQEYQVNNNLASGDINKPDEHELEEDFFNTESNEEFLFNQEELQDIYNGNKKKQPEKTQTYIKKEEQYKDLISSAFSFLVISIIGILLLSINAMGFISLFNGAMTYIVMGGLFVAFLYIGITTLMKAKKVKSQIGEENQVTEAINSWLSLNVTKESLNELVNPTDSHEIQFMQKIDKMKERIINQFGELDDLYLDRIVEEYYNNHFEE